MGYRGSEERLCENGHHMIWDTHNASYPNKCNVCGGKFAHWHSIDNTNGYYEDDPDTYQAAVREIGFTDEWKTDHYGNRYAVKHLRYAPARESAWRTYSTEDET